MEQTSGALTKLQAPLAAHPRRWADDCGGAAMGHFSSQLRSFCTLAVVALLSAPATGGLWKFAHLEQGRVESPMTRLRELFQRADSPREVDVLGSWVLIRHVLTEKFITGRDGPDHVLFDVDGVRREAQAGKELEWILVFSRGGAGKLQVKSDTVWVPTGDISAVDFNSEGDLTFEKQYGGDSDWIYRCRASNAGHLVCLLRGHESGHGVEFRKLAAAQQAAAADDRHGRITLTWKRL